MPAVKRNITIEQRATFKLTLTWKDAKSRPINLTGYSARLQIRASANTAVLFDASTTNGKIALGGTAGTIVVTITDEETALMTFLSGVYDLKLTAPDGSAVRLMQGNVTVSPGVTE